MNLPDRLSHELISQRAGAPHKAAGMDFTLRDAFGATFLANLDYEAYSATVELEEKWGALHEFQSHTKQIESKTNYHLLTDAGQAIEASLRATWTGVPKQPPRFAGDIIRFPRAEQWLAHRMNTRFIVPPDDSDIGSLIYLSGSYPRDGYPRTRKRPLPVWLIGERLPVTGELFGNTDEDSSNACTSYWQGKPGYHEYLALIPTAHTRNINVLNNRPTFDNGRVGQLSEFSIAHIATNERLETDAMLPTADDFRAAYDPNTKSFSFAQFRTDAESRNYPKAASFKLVWPITDACMLAYDIPYRLPELMADFKALDQLDRCINESRNSRGNQ